MNSKLLLFLCGIMLLASQGFAQQNTVTGKVTDPDEGLGIPGVNIQVQGTSIGTVTDIDGNFSIGASATNTLIFSYLGFTTQTIPVGSRSIINVSMVPDYQALSEVIVVGYGTQKKSDIISSVASVNATDMLKIPTTDIGEMLRGKVPGMQVTVGNAEPGGSSNILIRGKNSISGGNSPIIIVDGVPAGSINDINPNDIASMEVLKDAAAQAIYGARASNGVILITTKRGKDGTINVNYNGFYGVQSFNRNFDTYSGPEFAQLKRDAWRRDNPTQAVVDANIFTPIELEVLASGEYIDWEKEVLQKAINQNHNFSVSAGNEKSQIYTSLNYNNQGGVVPGTDFERVQLRVNVDQKINNWIKVGANTSFQLSDKNNPGSGGTLNRLVTTSPLGKIYNDDGTFRINPTGVAESFNPLLDLKEVSNLQNDRNDIINLFVDVTPFEGFRYRLNASRRSWNRKTTNYSTARSLLGFQRGGLGNGSIRFEDNMEYQVENIFSYDKSVNNHNFGATFVQSITETKYSTFSNNSVNFPNDLIGIYGLQGAQIQIPSIGANRRGLVSFVGRIQYDYAGKYYITGSARRDGSTVFGANNKWAIFPAIGLGWNIHREDFLQSTPSITNLKLRGSYGSVGNQAIDPYQSQSTAVQYDYVFDGVKRSGFAPGNFLPNPNLRWETSTTANVALDFGIWKSRVSGTVEFYNTKTKDLLVQQSLDASSGYTRRWYNIGEIQNQGVELSLNVVAIEKRDLVVDFGVQFSRNRNKILSLYGLDSDEDGIEDDDVANRWFIGYPIDVHYQYMPEGIWQVGEDIAGSHTPNLIPGDIKLRDVDPTDGLLNTTDLVITDANPKWFGSFFANASFKGFDFSANLLTVQGIIRNNPFQNTYAQGGSLRGVLNGVKQNYWTPENPGGNWPSPRESNDPLFMNVMGLQDASYFRIQNITLGYTFPEAVLSRLKVSRLRIYGTVQNPLTITKYNSYSPERNANEYPEMLNMIGGVQISF